MPFLFEPKPAAKVLKSAAFGLCMVRDLQRSALGATG